MRMLTIALCCGALLVLSAGAARACTTPNWLIVEPAEGASDFVPGTAITVRGGGYAAGSVELRWGGLEGTLLAEPQAGADGRFTATVTIPDDAPEGRESVTGVQATAEGTRLWGFTDIVVVAGAGASLLTAALLGSLALLLVAATAAWRVRRRPSAAAVDVDADSGRLVDRDVAIDDPEREPVGT
jgi:hypothetical protein